jgi:hypothetical protein
VHLDILLLVLDKFEDTVKFIIIPDDLLDGFTDYLRFDGIVRPAVLFS